MAVDEVEIRGMLEHFGDVKVLSHLGIYAAILFVPAFDHGMQTRAREGVPGSEQRDIPATRYQSFGDVAGDRLPRAVLPRRRAPCHRRQYSYSLAGNGHVTFM